MPDQADRSQAVIGEVRERPGEWLYHYTTLETALVHILPQQRLRLSPFSLMRDPRESKQWFPDAAGFFENVDESELPRLMAEATAHVNELRHEFKLLSTTLDGPADEPGEYERGYARSRLWELYAGRGTGVCLILSKAEAVATISAQLDAIGMAFHRPVHYENTPTYGDVLFNFEELFGDLNLIADRIARQHDHLFLTKNTEWESEREYRFIVRSPNEFEYVDVSTALAAVVRGPESPASAEHALRYFAREFDFALGHLLWQHNNPQIVGRSVDD